MKSEVKCQIVLKDFVFLGIIVYVVEVSQASISLSVLV